MLHIVHLNDTDSRQPHSWARAATAIRHLRQAGRCDLALHAGDVYLGAGPGPVRLLNDLGFDALTPGNHDFDHGWGALQADLAHFRGAAVCCNVRGLPPDQILERQGLRIALTGSVTPDLALLQPERHMAEIALADPAVALGALLPALRAQADLVILLSHCGLDYDRELARRVPGIDLIVGGHSHHRLEAPERIGKTAIVQAGAYGEDVGLVTIARTGELSACLLPTADFPPDEFAAAEAPEDGEIVGWTETDLRAADYAAETPLGNLTVDLMRAFAGTDLALLRCSTVNNAAPPGALRRRAVAELNACARDRVAVVELTGAAVRAVLECGARDRYYLLTLAGGRVCYDGARVAEVEVGGAPLEPGRIYSVACSEILARGAAGFTPMRGRPYRILHATVGELLESHIAGTKRIKPALDGRLVIKGALPAAR